jgi:SAM-dependent methyltransferase
MYNEMDAPGTQPATVGSTEFYDSVWENQWFDMERFNPTARHLERIIVNTIKSLDSLKTVADVGCGMGVNVKQIHGRLPDLKIIGTDISPKSLELAKSYVGNSPNVEYGVLNIESHALPQKFDLVICSQVLEHIENDQAAANNLAAMTGKYLLITVPGGRYNSTSKLVGHFRHYNKKQLVNLINATGLEILWAYEWGFPFHSIYKFLLDQLPVESQKSIGLGRYGFFKRMVSHILFGLFYLNRFNYGANVILLARAR